MTGLSQEIAKIGAYAKGEVITQRDIDAVADPVLSAEIFKMTDAVSQSDYNKAACHFGGPAENAGGAHRDPGGAGEPAAAALHRPDGH